MSLELAGAVPWWGEWGLAGVRLQRREYSREWELEGKPNASVGFQGLLDGFEDGGS